MDLAKRRVEFITAATPEELSNKLLQVNMLTGKMTEVINIMKEKALWYAWFYTSDDIDA